MGYIGFMVGVHEISVKKTMKILVILNGAQRSEESRRLRGEILHDAQNDKGSLLICSLVIIGSCKTVC
jgi:hypothetical protein